MRPLAARRRPRPRGRLRFHARLLRLPIGRGGTAEGAAGSAEAVASAADGVPHRVRVRLLDDSPELRDEMDDLARNLGRWTEGWSLEVAAPDAEPESGYDAGEALDRGHVPDGAKTPNDAETVATSAPAVDVLVDLLPLAASSRPLVRELPVDLSGDAVVLAGQSYADPQAALALHLPRTQDGAPPRWLVAGHDPHAVARLVAERVLSPSAIRRMAGRRTPTTCCARPAGSAVPAAGRATAASGAPPTRATTSPSRRAGSPACAASRPAR